MPPDKEGNSLRRRRSQISTIQTVFKISQGIASSSADPLYTSLGVKTLSKLQAILLLTMLANHLCSVHLNDPIVRLTRGRCPGLEVVHGPDRWGMAWRPHWAVACDHAEFTGDSVVYVESEGNGVVKLDAGDVRTEKE